MLFSQTFWKFSHIGRHSTAFISILSQPSANSDAATGLEKNLCSKMHSFLCVPVESLWLPKTPSVIMTPDPYCLLCTRYGCRSLLAGINSFNSKRPTDVGTTLFFILFTLFYYLFLALLGLHCCPLVVVCGLLIALVSLVADHRL